MRLVRPHAQRRSFSELNDRFLVCWVSIFGFYEFKQCLHFINVCPLFSNDFWFRGRDAAELEERVERLLKLQLKAAPGQGTER